MTLTLGNVVFAAFGALVALFGVWGAALADRIRYPRLRAELAAMRATPAFDSASRAPRPRPTRAANTPPLRKPQRRVAPVAPVAPAPRDDVAEWLCSMGYAEADARAAAGRARVEAPTASIEDRIRVAMTYLPESN